MAFLLHVNTWYGRVFLIKLFLYFAYSGNTLLLRYVRVEAVDVHWDNNGIGILGSLVFSMMYLVLLAEWGLSRPDMISLPTGVGLWIFVCKTEGIDWIYRWTFLAVVPTIGLSKGRKLYISSSWTWPSLSLSLLFIVAVFSTMFLSRDGSLRGFRSPCDSLSFSLFNLILASSNLTSSRKVSKATKGWTGGSQSDLTWKGWGSLLFLWNMYLRCLHRVLRARALMMRALVMCAR